MTHDPLCGLSQPCDEEIPEHGYCSMQHGEFCIHCHQWCICEALAKAREDAIAAAVQRVEALAEPTQWRPEPRKTARISDVIAAIKGEQP